MAGELASPSTSVSKKFFDTLPRPAFAGRGLGVFYISSTTTGAPVSMERLQARVKATDFKASA